MWAYGVVMAPPGFDENLGFLEGIEDLPVQELVAQPRVEALDTAVLPGRTRLDEGGPGPDRGNPSPDGLSDKLRAVIGADPGRNTAQDEQVGQRVDDIGRGELAPDTDRQALTGEPVQDVEGRKSLRIGAIGGIRRNRAEGGGISRGCGASSTAGASRRADESLCESGLEATVNRLETMIFGAFQGC